MITLTREEAQQVLDALEGSIDAQEWEINDHITKYGEWYRPKRVEYMKQQLANTNSTIETLRARLSAPEPEPVRLRRGDILRCIETNELCTVWATSTTGKTLVKWKENDFGEYTAEQIGDLFWLEPKPESSKSS